MEGFFAVLGGALFIILLSMFIVFVASAVADLMIAIDKFFDDDESQK